MFSADIGVMKGFRFFASKGENLFDSWGVGNVACNFGVRTCSNLFFYFHPDRFEIQPHFLEDIDGDALAQLDQAEENMLRAHIVVVKAVGLLAGKGEDLLCAGGEVVHRKDINPSRLEVQFTHRRFGNALKFLAKKIGAEGVPFLCPQFLL